MCPQEIPEERSWFKGNAPKTSPDDLKNFMGVFQTHHTSLVRLEEDFDAILSAPGEAKVGFGTNLAPGPPQG